MYCFVYALRDLDVRRLQARLLLLLLSRDTWTEWAIRLPLKHVHFSLCLYQRFFDKIETNSDSQHQSSWIRRSSGNQGSCLQPVCTVSRAYIITIQHRGHSHQVSWEAQILGSAILGKECQMIRHFYKTRQDKRCISISCDYPRF